MGRSLVEIQLAARVRCTPDLHTGSIYVRAAMSARSYVAYLILPLVRTYSPLCLRRLASPGSSAGRARHWGHCAGQNLSKPIVSLHKKTLHSLEMSGYAHISMYVPHDHPELPEVASVANDDRPNAIHHLARTDIWIVVRSGRSGQA